MDNFSIVILCNVQLSLQQVEIPQQVYLFRTQLLDIVWTQLLDIVCR